MLCDELISVIVPIFNVENYIEDCLESVLGQTYNNIEVVLINDGSTDNSEKICRKYVERDSRIVLYSKPNGGLSSARNYGIEKSNGQYITFIDSDDIIANTYVEDLYGLILRNEADISCGRITREKESLNCDTSSYEKVIGKREAIRGILLENGITTSASCKLFKRELWENVLFPEGKIFEDYATIYKIFFLSSKLAVTDKKLYYYRCNPAGITQSRFNKNRLQYFEITKEIRTFLDRYYPELVTDLENRATRYAISFFSLYSKSCAKKSKEIENELINNIRPNIIRYYRSSFSIFSKLYGTLICVSPTIARNVFRRRE